MKAEHRHELQQNVLAEWISTSADKVKPYSSLITVGCVVVAIGIAIVLYLQSVERRSKAEAAEQLIAAMQTTGIGELQTMASEYKGTEPAIVAQLLIAEQQLDVGTETLFSNKLAARENLIKAAESFALARDQAQDPMLKSWALYGLGRAHESLGELDRARNDYRELKDTFPDSALAEPARRALDRLDQPGVKEFYDWFARQDPRPPAADSTSGVPGMKPPFDLKEPAGASDLRLPTPQDEATSPLPTSDLPVAPMPESAAPPATPSNSTSSADQISAPASSSTGVAPVTPAPSSSKSPSSSQPK